MRSDLFTDCLTSARGELQTHFGQECFELLARTERECSEGLEQLRALDHGHTIRAAIVEDWHSVPVDVPEDVARVEAILRSADR